MGIFLNLNGVFFSNINNSNSGISATLLQAWLKNFKNAAKPCNNRQTAPAMGIAD